MQVRLTITLTLVLLASGCLAAVDPAPENAETTAGTGSWSEAYEFDGTLLAQGDTKTFTFDVPEGAAEVASTLTWDAPKTRLDFTLLGPDGEEVTSGWPEKEGRSYVTTTHPPDAGEWTVEVASTRGLPADFALDVTIHSDAEPHGPIDDAYTVPGRNPARDVPVDEARGAAYPLFPRDYAEINLNMDPGDHFNFSWSSDADVYFNVHYHGDGETVRPIEHVGNALEGSFTANKTEVYSLIWATQDLDDVDIEVSVDGEYRLHSKTRDV